MNPPASTEKDTVLLTKTAMGFTVWDYLWRLLLALILGTGLLMWLLYPHSHVLTWVLLAAYVTLCISDSVRRILRNRCALRLDGSSLQLNGYCGASFRLDGLKRGDFMLVQNPMERRLDTGRLLIRKQGIYLRCVKHFGAVMAHVEAYMPKES